MIGMLVGVNSEVEEREVPGGSAFEITGSFPLPGVLTI